MVEKNGEKEIQPLELWSCSMMLILTPSQRHDQLGVPGARAHGDFRLVSFTKTLQSKSPNSRTPPRSCCPKKLGTLYTHGCLAMMGVHCKLTRNREPMGTHGMKPQRLPWERTDSLHTLLAVFGGLRPLPESKPALWALLR